MIKKLILVFFLLGSYTVFGLEKLKDSYLVTYGDPNADVKITSYFSFICPHCVSLFRNDFSKIKERYLDNKKIYLVFHPVPMDLLTVQAMICLEQLDEGKKRIFLEAILQEIDIDDQEFSALMMEKAMEILERPIPGLRDKKFILETSAFVSAFEFLKQEEKIEAVPTIEVNGELKADEIPSKDFIDQVVAALTRKGC